VGLAAAAVLLGLMLALPSAGSASTRSAPVAQRVLQDASANGWADFIVVLRDQANPAAALSAETPRAERGQAVFDLLRGQANTAQPALIEALERQGAAYQPFWIVNAVAVRGSATLIEQLAARPDVARIVSNAPFKAALEEPAAAPSAPQAAQAVEWNLSWVNAPEMWERGFTGQGIVYANADTGVQWDHPALKNQYRGWSGTAADHNFNWWDGVRSPIENISSACGDAGITVPRDDYGHGTHTTGIGVGTSIDGNQIGIAPGAKWIGCRNMVIGVGRPSTYLSCFQFFLAPTDLNGANPDPSKRPDVVGNSYGCPPAEECIDKNVMQQALEALRAAGIFMAVSAGNDGPGCSTVQDPPGIEAAVFTVGATGLDNFLASFSSRGPVTADGSGRMKPELVAPGVGVYSSFPGDLGTWMNGTSMAAPHVSGAVALLWSALPALRGDVAKTEQILKESATPLLPEAGLCGSDTPTSVPNNHFGYGELNVIAAYRTQLEKFYLPVVVR